MRGGDVGDFRGADRPSYAGDMNDGTKWGYLGGLAGSVLGGTCWAVIAGVVAGRPGVAVMTLGVMAALMIVGLRARTGQQRTDMRRLGALILAVVLYNAVAVHALWDALPDKSKGGWSEAGTMAFLAAMGLLVGGRFIVFPPGAR